LPATHHLLLGRKKRSSSPNLIAGRKLPRVKKGQPRWQRSPRMGHRLLLSGTGSLSRVDVAAVTVSLPDDEF